MEIHPNRGLLSRETKLRCLVSMAAANPVFAEWLQRDPANVAAALGVELSVVEIHFLTTLDPAARETLLKVTNRRFTLLERRLFIQMASAALVTLACGTETMSDWLSDTDHSALSGVLACGGGGTEPKTGSRPDPPPVTIREDIETDGPIPPKVVSEMTEANQQGLDQCFAQHLPNNEEYRLYVQLTYTIEASGRVSSVAVTSGDIDEEMAQCLCQQIARWRFPALEGDSIVAQWFSYNKPKRDLKTTIRVVTEGTLETDVVRRAVSRKRFSLLPCVEQIGEGQIQLTYEINPTGIVSAVDVVSSDYGPEIDRCVARELLQWTFAESSGLTHVAQTTTFAFTN